MQCSGPIAGYMGSWSVGKCMDELVQLELSFRRPGTESGVLPGQPVSWSFWPTVLMHLFGKRAEKKSQTTAVDAITKLAEHEQV
jgi:hypothetical protein